MVRFVRPLVLAGAMLGLGAALPAVILAADPNANNDQQPMTAGQSAIIDVLENDAPGDATATRPLTITAVTAAAHGSVRTDGRSIFYDPTGCYTGNDSFSYTISDGSGPTDSATVIFNLARPSSVPITDVPQAGLVKGSTLGSTVPVRVSWCGAITSGGVLQAYRLTQSSDGGATFGSALVNGTGTSSTRSLAVGTPYAWRVRTTDSAGQSTATSLVTRVGRFQENSGAIAYSSGWKSASSGKYSGGKERYVAKKGARATLTVSNVREFAIVASRAPGRGSFHVYVDGVRVTGAAISQRARDTSWRKLLYVGTIPGDTSARHTIQVRTASDDRVDLDAILTLSGRAGQVVSFTTDPGPRVYAGDPWDAGASTSAGLPVLVTLTSASWPVCALVDGVVTFHGVGTCAVVATQYGDATFIARTTTQQIQVAPRPLAVTGITAQDRVYAPGVASATIVTTGAVLEDPLPADAGGVTLVTTGATGSFASDAAGEDRTVTVAGLTLTGVKAVRYTVTPPTTTATIERASQSVSFTTTAPDDAVEGGPAYDVAATATSGLAAAITVDAGSAGVCAVDDGEVTFVGDGSCMLVARQDGDQNWLPASAVSQTFTVADAGLTSQTITFAALADADYGDGPVTLSATASSGLTVAFASETPAVCSVSGTTLTLLAAGECAVEANQPGDGVYAPAAPVSRSFSVEPKSLAVTGVTAASRPYDGTDDATLGFGSAALVGVESGDDVTLDTAGAMGTFPGTGVGTAQTVTVSGLALDGDDAGSYVLNAVTTTASITKRTLTVTADDQAIEYGDPDPSFTFTYGPFAGSDDAGDIDTPPSCGVAGISRDVAGSPYPIGCSGGADTNYAFQYAGGTLVVSKGSQTISFTSTAPTGAEVGGPAYAVAATATSGLDVAITIDPASAGVCAIDQGEVSFVGGGTCTLDADQAGDANWLPASTVSQTFTVAADAGGTQTITFGALGDAVYGDGPLVLSATASSGLTVAFASETAAVCSVSGTTLTLLAAGECTVEATQPGNGAYAPAAPVDRTFTVGPRTLTVTADDQAIAYGQPDPEFTFAYSTFVNGEGPGVLDTAPTCGIASPSRDVAGSPYTISCSGGLDTNYAFTYASGTLVVSQASQTISFTTTPPSPATVGGTYIPAATATSGLTVTIILGPGSAGNCTFDGTTVAFVGTGMCRLRANQAGDGNHLAAAMVQQTVDITGP